jgi:hypothetical protein
VWPSEINPSVWSPFTSPVKGEEKHTDAAAAATTGNAYTTSLPLALSLTRHVSSGTDLRKANEAKDLRKAGHEAGTDSNEGSPLAQLLWPPAWTDARGADLRTADLRTQGTAAAAAGPPVTPVKTPSKAQAPLSTPRSTFRLPAWTAAPAERESV